MTLLEHMEELRDRIVKSVIAIGVAFVAGIFLAGPLLKRLQIEANAIGGFDVVSPTDPITLYFKIALYIAIGIALPVLMWQLVGFLVPGLTKKEKRLLYLSHAVCGPVVPARCGVCLLLRRAARVDVPLWLHE